MNAFSPILPMLREFYQRADWSDPAARYVVQHALDLDEINAHAGIMAVLPGEFEDNGFFNLVDDGEPACIIEALGEDAETVIDLVAWPLARPKDFATAIGAAPVLGWTNITNAASWAFGSLLSVHRTPLGWLQAGCQGAVILDHRSAPLVLGEALGPLLAEDAGHASDLKKLLCRPPVKPSSILYASEMAVAA